MKSFRKISAVDNTELSQDVFESTPDQNSVPFDETCWICSKPIDGDKKYLDDKVCNDCYNFEKQEREWYNSHLPEGGRPFVETLDPEEQTDGGAWNMHDASAKVASDYIFDPDNPDIFEARQTAYDWHSGQWSPLYEFASSGKTSNNIALINDIEHCISLYEQDPSHYEESDGDKLQNLLAVAKAFPDNDEIEPHQASKKDAASSTTVKKALESLVQEILPAMAKNPYLKSFTSRIHTIQGRLAFALENLSEDELLKSAPIDKFVNIVLELRNAVRSGHLQMVDMPVDPDRILDELENSSSHIVTSAIVLKRAMYPTPERFVASFGPKKAKIAMKQEDFIMDSTKIIGKPGQDPDSINFFDDKELFRRFYSQFFEGAVMIADDGTMYQVLEVVSNSGNFIAMLQDVLHPQIVFTISVNDLVAHIWKWITPFTVVVNPDLAPDVTNSVSDIISVKDLDDAKVPESWLSY